MNQIITRMNPSSLPDAGKVGYSQVSISEGNRFAFVSGQVAWQVDSARIPDTLAGQTTIVINNLKNALAAIEVNTCDILQMRIYLTDLNLENQEIVMSLLSDFLGDTQPSLTGIGVSALAAPELQIEIEMVVQLPA